LIPLYRNWQIYHTQDLKKLEDQLTRFPRWKHDDCADCLQMAYYMYEMRPNTNTIFKMPKIKYDKFWNPVLS
jgi:phage terminase large subunit-like protein